ncbi:porin [Klebsiella oxytoca]|uniref:porin n=1 Tax=Klebsiella oxytoca TaxID=571 RepID=UPI0035715CE9
MKNKISYLYHFFLALVALMPLRQASAAEVYNKNGTKLDIYGWIQAQRYITDNTSIKGDQSILHLGIVGEIPYNDEVSAYGHYHARYSTNSAEEETNIFSTSFSYAGVKFKNYGSLDYGRNWGVMYDLSMWTDVLPELGGDIYRKDNFLIQRATGVLTYSNSGFFGLIDDLDIKLQYQGKNGGSDADVTSNSRNVLMQNGDGYGMSAIYHLGKDMSVGVAGFSSERTADQNGYGNSDILGRGKRAYGGSAGLKYDDGHLSLAAVYRQIYNGIPFGRSSNSLYGFADKAQQVELVGQYQFDSGLRPLIAYAQSRGDIENSTEELDHYFDISLMFFFTKNADVFVEHKINLLKDNAFTNGAGINTDDVTTLGFVYRF